MKFVSITFLLLSTIVAENNYCNTSNENDNMNSASYRNLYNIGDTITEEDQNYPYSVCHSDGNYNVGASFKLDDYNGNILLISMNATW